MPIFARPADEPAPLARRADDLRPSSVESNEPLRRRYFFAGGTGFFPFWDASVTGVKPFWRFLIIANSAVPRARATLRCMAT